MPTLQEQYSKAFENELKIDIDLAFSDDCPQWQSDLWESDAPACYQLAETMLLEGVTHWGHLAFWKDVLFTFNAWVSEPSGLIKTRLIAQWLLTTLPDTLLDADIPVKLKQIASGDFCSAFEGDASLWPPKKEHYLRELKWSMVEPAIDSEMSRLADGKVLMIQKWGKVA